MSKNKKKSFSVSQSSRQMSDNLTQASTKEFSDVRSTRNPTILQDNERVHTIEQLQKVDWE